MHASSDARWHACMVTCDTLAGGAATRGSGLAPVLPISVHSKRSVAVESSNSLNPKTPLRAAYASVKPGQP